MDNCIFCKIISGQIKSWKVYENDHIFAFFDIHPVNKYHTLVIPKKHYQNIFDLPEDEFVEISKVIKKITSYYKENLGIENVQIINSSGKIAQQDVFHAHFHIVPRLLNDFQDIKWTTHPEYSSEFDQLLSNLKIS